MRAAVTDEYYRLNDHEVVRLADGLRMSRRSFICKAESYSGGSPLTALRAVFAANHHCVIFVHSEPTIKYFFDSTIVDEMRQLDGLVYAEKSSLHLKS